MVAGDQAPAQAKPYSWDETMPPPSETLRLWTEVGNGLDKSQTVVWKSAVESLDQANKFLTSSADARYFVEKYMAPIISILVEQLPTKIGPHERNCVQESLNLAVIIVAKDLSIQLARTGQCHVLDVLSLVFNKKKAYYKGNKGSWNVNHLSGLPEVRLQMIDRFRLERGFTLLQTYLIQHVNTPQFPSLELLHQILAAIADAVPNRPPGADHAVHLKEMEDDAIAVSKAVMFFINSTNDETLKKLSSDQLQLVRYQLRRIFDRLISTRRDSSYEFYDFWRSLTLKLITSQSLPLKLMGWEEVNELIESCAEHRPPPRSFLVTNAGCTFVNGEYNFAGATTKDGYAQRQVEISYERRIPDTAEEGAGKKLTLFRCTMRSQQKWWFLSEADEEQPGTDRDIDYYQHKSKAHEESEPPPHGWVTCRNAGIDPPPTLQSVGRMVPPGEEFNTLEHQLARWAIENKIIELVLGDSVHREVVARSTLLIKFLASMCERDQPVESEVNGKPPNAYCLQTSHLLLAWKTCTKKADAAVAAQVYQLLVSILPSLPARLAIPLLEEVQTSLRQSTETRHFLNEVAEFCSALASANPVDMKSGGVPVLGDDVRAEVLELLWAVLTHPDASSLKAYDSLKRYVTTELRVEPRGSAHRERFLKSCVTSLTANSKERLATSVVDEVQALRMVKLTMFVLEACTREQTETFLTENNGALPTLLFSELTAYVERRKPAARARKLSNPSEPDPVYDVMPLAERLRILRYAYGISEQTTMSSPQLHNLWKLCDQPAEREELMVFIASASGCGPAIRLSDSLASTLSVTNSHPQSSNALSAVISEEVCLFAFLELFCSQSISYEQLGEGAYTSFQFLFKKLRQSPESSHKLGGPALDALWRICLMVENDGVAAQAMRDLLAVYVTMSPGNRSTNGWAAAATAPAERMETDDEDEKFEKRVFDYLVGVKQGLEAGDGASQRSAERCLRILNAAIGQNGSAGRLVPSSTVKRLTGLPQDIALTDALKCLPHGMRGQASYRRVGILAKRTAVHNQQVSQSFSAREDASSTSSQARSSTHRFSLDVHPLETLASIKSKVATYCDCAAAAVKPVSVSGRAMNTSTRSPPNDPSNVPLNVVSEDCLVDELGIMQGCEMVFVIADRQMGAVQVSSPKTSRTLSVMDLSDIFFNTDETFADRLFQMLLGVLDALPWPQSLMETDSSSHVIETHKLVWDLLQAMPTNSLVSTKVQVAADATIGGQSAKVDAVPMAVDSPKQWPALLELRSFHSSVYVLQVIDHFLQPAIPEIWSILPIEQRTLLENELQTHAVAFRQGFIGSGGFDAVVRFFSASDGDEGIKQSKTRMGNAVALRILKCCLFGSRVSRSTESASGSALDGTGTQLLQSLSDAEGLLMSLTAMVISDSGISTSTISDVLKFLRLLFRSHQTALSFVSLQSSTAEKFLITLLLWEGGSEASRSGSNVGAASKVRKSAHDLILATPILADHALQWLIRAIDTIDVSSDSTSEYFDVLQKLVAADKGATAQSRKASELELKELGTGVCRKLASCPRPTSESSIFDFSTGVLCCSLALLRALIENGGGGVLRDGTAELVEALGVKRWSEMIGDSKRTFLGIVASSLAQPKFEDSTLIDLMGAVFDGFLCPGGSSSVVAICCDKESRQRGFEVVGAAARTCQSSDGYTALVARITDIVRSSAPFLRHRWGQNGTTSDGNSRSLRNPSKYSGLRNQGCTCYMNSVLQQLFMMHELRKVICNAPIPTCLRSSGGGVVSAKGAELVGKKLALQWESGVSYDAVVEAFDPSTGMHTIRYCRMQVATVGGGGHQQVHPDDIADLPPDLPDEFLLSEGRPGKETGVFEVVTDELVPAGPEKQINSSPTEGIEETDDEATSRHLLEEVQRTFIHLDEGSRGRCFDPRALVEACGCLKLEFDVWQQNDASEFATKLLDRLEISLKRWAPSHCRYLDHTFGLKQTKQKICKECGLKTNREEKLMNIDCQIRGKADIHEALTTMTEVEIMEGNNKVFCDRCKKNTDTVLRTAISALPNMLILSLKRFDLDYNTFETVKLNSRCEFGQTLNMKKFTLEGLEELGRSKACSPMDTEEDERPSPSKDVSTNLADEDYEYKLVGVLVHAGVAQGGHYYSFIKDRNPGTTSDKWYRFDDEDVTPFDPASIETECFGGKVKKETKWPNGQVHTVENEQYANALMLFYEKVRPTDPPADDESQQDPSKSKNDTVVEKSSGFDVFEPDVRRSNATHRWQTFLFDLEFQTFLKGLLGLCRLSSADADRMDIGKPTSPRPSAQSEGLWRSGVVHMLLTFVFDVLLYSADKSSLHDWVRMIEQTMAGDRECARVFVRDLSKRTRTVSCNWLRTYLSDCPDQPSRRAAVRIFSAAMRSCAWFEDEQNAVSKWSLACAQQAEEELDRKVLRPFPTSLEAERQILENVNEFESGRASCLGVIISFVNELLEAAPRIWRYNPELCRFIRNLSSLGDEFGGNCLREAMISALVPPRLICLVIRERAPRALRAAFPGASVSVEAAETQIRTEPSSSPHVMSLSGNQVMNATELGSRAVSPLPSDYLMLFEALGCFAQLQGIILTPLVYETDESTRGRPRVLLTDQAKRALELVFKENGGSSEEGLGQREIEIYLQRCGLEAIPPQKIADMMAKYPTTVGSNGSGSLSLEGFLAYYRDTAQTNEARVRADLHTFGFRPDLSRRSDESRFYTLNGRQQCRTNSESVAIDVARSISTRGRPHLGRLAHLGFQSFHLYVVAHSASDVLAEHLLAGVAYESDTSHLLLSTLKNLYQAPTGWAGNETWAAALVVLRVLASLPDSRQRERITFMMQSMDKPVPHAEHGAGLLVAARVFHDSRQGQHFSSELHFAFDRYVAVLKELLRVEKVYVWMAENRSSWSWMERELRDQHVIHQARTDYPARRDFENSSIPLDNHHSDSDMAGMNDSEDEEDDDSRFEELDGYGDGIQSILVEGAGIPSINGIYVCDGEFGCDRYSKVGEHNDEKVLFVLFQCNVSNNTKHWYISIVPKNGQPGTNTDIDFYSVPVTEASDDYPPMTGWTKAPEGKDPPPTVKLREQRQSSGETENVRGQRPVQVWNNTGEDATEEDDNQGRYYI